MIPIQKKGQGWSKSDAPSLPCLRVCRLLMLTAPPPVSPPPSPCRPSATACISLPTNHSSPARHPAAPLRISRQNCGAIGPKGRKAWRAVGRQAGRFEQQFGTAPCWGWAIPTNPKPLLAPQWLMLLSPDWTRLCSRLRPSPSRCNRPAEVGECIAGLLRATIEAVFPGRRTA